MQRDAAMIRIETGIETGIETEIETGIENGTETGIKTVQNAAGEKQPERE
jgi:hypothetical protein